MKPVSTAIWITVGGITGTDQVLNDLLAGATYKHRVRTECVGGPSAYSPVQEFTTPCRRWCSLRGRRPVDGERHHHCRLRLRWHTAQALFQEINKIVASDRSINAAFGTSVSISGDYAIVGARIGEGSGAAYIYIRSGNTWVEQLELQMSDGSGGDGIGCSVAIDGLCHCGGKFRGS